MQHLDFDPNVVYMTPTEAKLMLGLSIMQVKELCWQKKIETARVCGRILLYRADVEAMAAKGGPVIPSTPDAWARRKKQEQTHGVPANSQFSNS